MCTSKLVAETIHIYGLQTKIQQPTKAHIAKIHHFRTVRSKATAADWALDRSLWTSACLLPAEHSRTAVEQDRPSRVPLIDVRRHGQLERTLAAAIIYWLSRLHVH